MRILLLAPAPSGGSGAAAYNADMVAALRALGHNAELLTLTGCYPALCPAPADLDLLATLPQPAHLVLDGIAFALHAALPAPITALIHQPSALLADQPTGQTRLAAMERAALAALPRLIATSATVATRLTTEYGVPAERIRSIPPGLPPDLGDAPRTAPSGGPCQILTLGPLVPRRAHDQLLLALARLTDLDWRLTLIGSATRDPAHAAHLDSLIAQAGLQTRVTLLDSAPLLPWPTTDLLALAHPVPSLDVAMRQALGRGIPLLLCGTEPPLSPDGTALCPPDDPDTLSKVLRRLIVDTALRRRMADAAWRTGQSLPSWPTQAAAFAAALG